MLIFKIKNKLLISSKNVYRNIMKTAQMFHNCNEIQLIR